MKIGDIVINEYNNVGKITNIYNDEATIVLLGSDNDEDFCDITKCNKATDEDIFNWFN